MTSPRLRILMVSPGLPHRSWGFGTRVYHLARHLGSRHSVTVLAYGPADEEEREATALAELRSTCELRIVRPRPLEGAARRWSQAAGMVSRAPFAWREVHSPAMQAAIDEVVSHDNFDVVQVESSQMCSYRFPETPLVLDEHNVEYELLRRMQATERSALRRLYNRREHAKFRRFEQRLWRQVDACVVTSGREEQIVKQCAPMTPTAVVPNAVDLDFFVPDDGEPEAETMVFTGLLSYRPNLDAVRYLVDKILPEIARACPNVRLTVVGKGNEVDLADLERPNVTITGWVPDIRPHMARGAVAVVPVRMGSGTRLKVIEALAMGKAMVSTAVGCEGVNVRDGVHLLIADDPARFAASVVHLFSDPVLGRNLGRAGRALVADEYSWANAGQQLEEIYDRVVKVDPIDHMRGR